MTSDSTGHESAPNDSVYHGFIVHGFTLPRPTGFRICLIGRLTDGTTFAVIEDRFVPTFHVRESDLGEFRERFSRGKSERRDALDRCLIDAARTTLDAERVVTVAPVSRAMWTDCVRAAAGIGLYESDIGAVEQLLMARRVHGSVRIVGAPEGGRRVARLFRNPDLHPGENAAAYWERKLSVMSFDIETDALSESVRAIGAWSVSPWSTPDARVFLLGDHDRTAPQKPVSGEAPEPTIVACASESDLLARFIAYVDEFDPDILTGWNIVEFDLRVIAARCRALGVPFTLGRSDEQSKYLAADRDSRRIGTAIVAGRFVLDGVRVARAGPERFDDHRLETVANAVLGTGKTVATSSTHDKLAELERLFTTEPYEFARYCFTDAYLVERVLRETGLLSLTLARTLSIGIPVQRAWTSIAAFEHVYIEALHDRNLVAPDFGVDTLPMDDAPGGAILDPRPGVFSYVLVFDFKSLYPSIIRTFNIDPVALHLARNSPGSNDIVAPNGASFSRNPGILPSLLDRFFEARDEAKARGDQTASYVYKIIMNSFYGVLGSSGCRFGSSLLAGAITGFGQQLLRWCRDAAIALGYEVVYGDTDSLFVLLGSAAGREPSYDDVTKRAERLRDEVNEKLSKHVRATWECESLLELEFEKTYERFFLPAVRGTSPRAANDGGTRGRAKGYAGRVMPKPGIDAPDEIEVKGMEAVRRDWTELAHAFQRGLLHRVFDDAPCDELRAYVRGVVEDVRSGRRDDELAYTKQLRKAFSAYAKSIPQHVRAAEKLDPADRSGNISYVVTTEGPQPIGRVSAKPDYEHYIQKQLKPIAEAFSHDTGCRFDAEFDPGAQLNLFEP
ncbi:MAG: DNA polymerase II [Spirochaetaceae bacterium]|nr:MAG: DNA polymerase II [Spirochaetaceae bacterium]